MVKLRVVELLRAEISRLMLVQGAVVSAKHVSNSMPLAQPSARTFVGLLKRIWQNLKWMLVTSEQSKVRLFGRHKQCRTDRTAHMQCAAPIHPHLLKS